MSFLDRFILEFIQRGFSIYFVIICFGNRRGNVHRNSDQQYFFFFINIWTIIYMRRKRCSSTALSFDVKVFERRKFIHPKVIGNKRQPFNTIFNLKKIAEKYFQQIKQRTRRRKRRRSKMNYQQQMKLRITNCQLPSTHFYNIDFHAI